MRMSKEQTRRFIELLREYDTGVYPDEYEGEALCYREDAILSAVEDFIEENYVPRQKETQKEGGQEKH